MIDDYHDRMNWVQDKLENDATPDKIKLDILNFLELGENVPCDKCEDWFDTMMKLSKDMR